MKLTATLFLTLDGVYQAPGGPDEDREGGFEHGGWLAPYFNEEMGKFVDEWFGQADAFLFGRKTYDIFASYWPKQGDGDPVSTAFNNLPKYVPSTTRTAADLTWAGTTHLDGDVAQALRDLKAQPGSEIQVHGSGALLRWLGDHDLVDEYRLWIFPVVVGAGKRLFTDGVLPTKQKLVDSRTTSTGVTVQCYRPDGRPEYGTVGE